MALPSAYIVPSLGEFGDFDAWDGGALQIQHTDYIASGQRSPEKVSSTHSFSPITLTRAYDPVRDRALEEWVGRYKEGLEGPRTFIVKFQNQQKIVQDTRTFPVAKPSELQLPPGQSGDGAIANLRLTLEVEGYTL